VSDEVKQEDKAGQGRGPLLDPEIFLAVVIVFGIALAWIGLAFRIPSALIGALTLGTIALVTGDLVWSLDFLRAAGEAKDEGTKKALNLERDRFNRVHRPLSLLAGSLAFVIFTGWTVFASFAAVPDKALWAWIAFAANILTGVLLWWIGPKLSTGLKSSGSESTGTLTPWLRFSAIIIWIAAPASIGSVYSIESSPVGYLIWLYRIAGILALAFQAELFIRASWSLISPKAKVIEETPLPTLIGSISMGWQYGIRIEKGENRIPSLFSDNRLRWLTVFFRQSLPRVVLGLLAIMWLATSFVQVGVSEQGVRERFGGFTGEILEPGMHVGWPWPIDRVRRFPSRRLHIMQIGFQAQEYATRTNLIWTEAHGIEEDRFVTANGNEVISFDIELYYRISDIVKFAYTSNNPEALLKDIAYKAILLRTNATDSDSLLSRDRSELASGLKEDIQRACDSEEIGIDVSQVAIIAIHPPFEVAAYYQAVVSMQVYADTLAIQASTYREEIIPTRQAEAQISIDEASAYAARRVAIARGEAQGFTLVADAARPAFDVYSFRRRISALETGLEGKRLFIVSSRFIESERGDDRGLWFDLR